MEKRGRPQVSIAAPLKGVRASDRFLMLPFAKFHRRAVAVCIVWSRVEWVGDFCLNPTPVVVTVVSSAFVWVTKPMVRSTNAPSEELLLAPMKRSSS